MGAVEAFFHLRSALLRSALLWLGVLALSFAPNSRGQTRPDNAPAPLEISRAGRTLTLALDEPFDSLRLWRPDAPGWVPHFAHGPSGGLDERTLRNNREQQIYVDPGMNWPDAAAPANATIEVENGVLALVARPTPAQVQAQVWDYDFISGMVSSHRLFSQTYGYFEIRARLPKGRGLWPAFWLLRQDRRWPPEIDVLESLGHESFVYYASYHSRVDGRRSAETARIVTPDLSADFHEYGMLWTPDELVWFFDGGEVAREPTPSDMHAPMYVLLNLAVGGVWGGAPDATTPFPARYEIDYLRAYRLSDGSRP